MNNHIIGYLTYEFLRHLINTNHFKDINEAIHFIVNKVKERHNTISTSFNTTTIDYNDMSEFSAYDNIVLYRHINTGNYHLGKWKIDTISKYNKSVTGAKKLSIYDLCQSLTNYIKTINNYNNENRLQETDSTCRERDESEGIGIKVERSRAKVEIGQISNGTSVSC